MTYFTYICLCSHCSHANICINFSFCNGKLVKCIYFPYAKTKHVGFCCGRKKRRNFVCFLEIAASVAHIFFYYYYFNVPEVC